MSTDPAVTAAEQAVRTRVFASAAEAAVAAARSIIEAEVRERIAADIEAEFQHIVTFGGAEPPAFMDATQRSAYDLGYHDGAARIARGQS